MGQPSGNPWGGLGTGWAVTATLAAGIGAWGGLGYLADRLLGLRWLFFPIGVILGAIGGIYLVYLRWGKGDREG
jgi:ABC-type enterobactin transport system permease subunit